MGKRSARSAGRPSLPHLLPTASCSTGIRDAARGARRGLYCGMGTCFDWLVTINGKANQRACLAAVAAGQQIRSRMPEGSAEDPLAPIWPPPEHYEPLQQKVEL